MKRKKEYKKQLICLKKRTFIAIIVIFIIIVGVFIGIINKQKRIINSKSEEMVQIGKENYNKQKSTISIENWDMDKVNVVFDSEGVPVPVPKGFISSKATGENTISSGFVIYELDELDDENFEINDDNAWEMSINRNQFVWVPIYKPNDLYGRDADGVARGKLYFFNSAGRSPCEWSELSDGTMVIDTSKNYEPIKEEVETSYAPEHLSEEARAYNKNFENMIESTIKYGGFYIGRYETGFTSSGANVHRMNTEICIGQCNDMTNRCKTITTNKNVVTEMLYGCQYDAVLQWFYDTGKVTYDKIYKDSSSWGNYMNTTFSYYDNNQNILTKGGGKIPTGSADYTKVNNIYDLAGNVWEWTQEVYGSSSCTSRGGGYLNYGSGYQASYRNMYSRTFSNDNTVGCRSTLYIALDTE